MRRSWTMTAIAACLALVLAGSPAAAQDGRPKGGATGLQGDVERFMNNRWMHAFYDLSVATMRKAPLSEADIAAYEQKSWAIFGDFGEANGGGRAQMIDHLKAVPRQVVKIAADDPHALDSFQSFVEAMVGPP